VKLFKEHLYPETLKALQNKKQLVLETFNKNIRKISAKNIFCFINSIFLDTLKCNTEKILE
jgi:hypothetical protein